MVTGTRADYGLLRWVMEGVRDSAVLDLQLVATGMHLSPEFGLTVESIKADGFKVDRSVEMLLSSDTPVGVTKSMGLGMIGMADAFSQLRPDLVLLLGDRYEAFSAAAAALIARIPIAHLHGGETSEGAFDEALRHSMTKMSHLHFVAAEEYRNRVIQLGEHPDSVFCVGGLGIDSIQRMDLLNRSSLEKALGFRFLSRNLMVTFHPVTMEENTSGRQMSELLAALDGLDDTGIIFTMPNADTEGRGLIGQIEEFCESRGNARAYTSLGQLLYLSCLLHVDGVAGNSSSGLLEAPSFRKGTVNIGDRQKGRLRAMSVIDCEPDRASISAALKRLYSETFQSALKKVENPYGSGGASKAIVEILERHDYAGILKKKFYNIPLA